MKLAMRTIRSFHTYAIMHKNIVFLLSLCLTLPLSQVVKNAFSRKKDSTLNPVVGDVFLSVLPCWHIFERTAEYFCLARGCKMVYSNVAKFKPDLSVIICLLCNSIVATDTSFTLYIYI